MKDNQISIMPEQKDLFTLSVVPPKPWLKIGSDGRIYVLENDELVEASTDKQIADALRTWANAYKSNHP